MLHQTTFLDSLNATSLPVLAGGRSPFGLPDGPKITPSGQDHAHANHSATRGDNLPRRTNAICGPSSETLSASAALQRSLENRLRANLDVNGSPEYLLTWKEWAMPLRVPICALRASARPISDNAYTGWQTPKYAERHPTKGHPGIPLTIQAQLCGWATPTVQDSANNAGPSQFRRNSLPLNCEATLAITENPKSFNVGTEKRAVLNPDHSRWLMGFPVEWGYCGVMAMQSFHPSRRNSSKPAESSK